MNTWSVIYESAIKKDGSLFFPERLTKEFLDNALRTQGSYIFANQYQNEIIPEGDRVFKEEWFKYYDALPHLKHTYCFIDPAISLEEHSDYTGIVIADIAENGDWYIRLAKKIRLTPTQIVSLCFDIQKYYEPMVIGIEAVAYQKALLYFLDEEMKRRSKFIPIRGINPPTDKTKQMRIMSLVPRFEWGHIYLNKGLKDLELELLTFPRAAHDDISDALAYIEYIAQSPTKEPLDDIAPHPSSPQYEAWYIRSKTNPRKQLFEPEDFSVDFKDILNT